MLSKGDRRLAARIGSVDPRRWEGGTEIKFTARFAVPVNTPTGAYRMSLWLPDETPGLSTRPEYSIRFANAGIWDAAQGFNVIADAFRIDGFAKGLINPGAKEFSEIR